MVEALGRLRAHFEIVHIHGNNVGGRTFIGDQAFPSVVEVTLANKALYAVADDPETFPTLLDTPNDLRDPDYFLGDFRIEEKFADTASSWEKAAARTPDAALFNAKAYLLANPDVAAARMDAFSHWHLYGRAENRCLSLEEKTFDPNAYLDANPDVAQAGFDPLTQWRHFGQREVRPLAPARGAIQHSR